MSARPVFGKTLILKCNQINFLKSYLLNQQSNNLLITLALRIEYTKRTFEHRWGFGTRESGFDLQNESAFLQTSYTNPAKSFRTYFFKANRDWRRVRVRVPRRKRDVDTGDPVLQFAAAGSRRGLSPTAGETTLIYYSLKELTILLCVECIAELLWVEVLNFLIY